MLEAIVSGAVILGTIDQGAIIVRCNCPGNSFPVEKLSGGNYPEGNCPEGNYPGENSLRTGEISPFVFIKILMFYLLDFPS